jgi:diguanylate cyclase (GGDEF)-like protein
MALQFRLPSLRQLTLPLVVFATGCALSLALGYATREEILRSAQVRFDSTATALANKVEDRLGGYTEVLIGLRSLFNTEETVTREQFRQYVAGLELRRSFPGFRVLNFVSHVPAGERKAFEARLRAEAARAGDEAYAQYTISPPGDRAEYYPLTFIEPIEGNAAMLGDDLGAKPFALKALQASRDSGETTSSGHKIALRGKQANPGMAVRLPVYRAGMPLGTVEQRRAAYRGSVGAGFVVSDMLGDIALADRPGAPRLRFYDTGPCANCSTPRITGESESPATLTDANLLFDSASGGALAERAHFARTLRLQFGGRNWAVQVTQDADQVVGVLNFALPWLIVLGGVVISLLLAGIVHSLATARRRAIDIATTMTRDLRTSERRLDEAQHLASVGSWVLDADTGALHCSQEAARIFGFDGNETQPELAALLARVPAAERETVEREIACAASSNERREFEHHLRLPEAGERWVHAIVQRAEENGRTALRGTVRDDTQRHKGALRLQFEHDIARLLAGAGEPDVVLERALHAICTHLGWHCGTVWRTGEDRLARCGPAWCIGDDALLAQFAQVSRSLNYRADEGSLGRAWSEAELVWIDTSTAARDFTRDALARQAGLAVGVVVPLGVGGRPAALELFSRDARPADAETLDSLRAVAMQIAQYEQRGQAELALRHMATHDALTGLSNRAALQQRLGRAIKRSIRHQKRLAVMFVDLDRFKQINDTLGHGVGDAMIKACGERLAGVLREGDTVARFGGDEFVIVLEDLSNATDAAVVADKVLNCCAEPFTIDGRELHVSASIGVSVYPEDGRDGETLLKNADTAMYRAKDKGRAVYQFYAAQMHAQGTERLMLENGLRRALERDELVLYYQPKMDLRTRAITGVEALMRWRHPVLGLVAPDQFIPIAEETGLIEAMGRWALERACTDARAWQQYGLPALQMSVNLSTRQLNGARLIADIAEILDSTGIEPSLLELEITESAMMRNPEHAATLLRQLRGMGVTLAIDDFGTGYSSLSYLKRFPLSTVKIDRSFIKDLSHDRDAQALTDAIITLAHGLRMRVVAEGVETAEQLACLQERGCDEMQGFWLCKAIPADDVRDFIARSLRKQFVASVPA